MNLKNPAKRILLELNDREVPYILIINPLHGDLKDKGLDKFTDLLTQMQNKDLINLGIFVTRTTSVHDIMTAMNIFSGYSFSLIHTTESPYKNEFVKMKNRISYQLFIDGNVSSSYLVAFIDFQRVLIRDSYISKSKNADYPEDELFSDLFSTYKNSGYYGFGDYQMVGSKLTTGGPAHAVALHLTYLKERNGDAIWIRHFISDDVETPANVQGKYFQALGKLVGFLDGYKNTTETMGVILYRENFIDEKYHGLGYPKRLSMMHHIELMTQLI